MNAGVHQYEDKLLDYAYGELPAHEAAAVDAHVRTCAKCSQALVQIRGVRSVFAPLPMVAAPDAGLESLLAYADQHARRAKETTQPPWRRWIFAFASAAALLVVGVVAVRASDESPQRASDIVVGAEKKSKGTSRADLAPSAAPVPAAPMPAQQGGEAQAEAAIWDERQGKRGGLDQADPKTVTPDLMAGNTRRPADPTPSENDAKPALGYADKGSELAPPAADAPMKEAAEKKNLAQKPVAKGDVDFDNVGSGRASASKREQAPVANEEELRPDYGNAGRGVALETAKAGKKRPTDNRDGMLNDGTTAKQSAFEGTANGPGFGVSPGSLSSAGSLGSAGLVDDKTVEGKVAEKKKQADRPEPVAVTSAPAMSPPPPPQGAAPSQPSPVQAPRKSSSYGLPRSAPSQAVDEDSVSMTESVARSGDLEARRMRDQQLNVDAQLAQSRSASNSGDRRGEVMAAVAALNAGAKGYSRLEALKRACDGYEAMGEFDRAQPYCERVVAEFSGSAAARQVAERRKAQLKSPKSPSPASNFESDKRDEASPAEPVQAQ
ncbi:MAG: zf-HC2 domain-containing protein [Myxococcales bacterium]|nr:zf-HC2 domain-containing protein [Myxococcales bacterium]